MANALYNKFKQRLLDPNGSSGSGCDLNTDTIKVSLRTSSTVLNQAHEFYSDLAGSAVGTDQTLTSPTVTSGVFDAADATWTAVAGGSTVTSYVVYKSTGTGTTSNLIAWFDTDAQPAAINIVTNGGNISLIFNASGIFAL